MARMSIEIHRRVICLHHNYGFKLKDIQLWLMEEDIFVSKRSLCLLIKYKLHGTILDMPRPGKLVHLKIIDSALEQGDETSAVKLHGLLREAGIRVSVNPMCKEEIRLDTCFCNCSCYIQNSKGK